MSTPAPKTVPTNNQQISEQSTGDSIEKVPKKARKSIFTSLIKNFGSKIWTRWSPGMKLPEEYNSGSGSEHDGYYIYSAKKEDYVKKTPVYLRIRNSWLFTFKSKSCKEPLCFADLTWAQMTMVQSQDEEGLSYGLDFVKGTRCASVYHRNEEKITALFNYFCHYCVLKNFKEDFLLQEVTGEGKFGKVHAIMKRSDQRRFAAKVYLKEKIIAQAKKSERGGLMSGLMNEIGILRVLARNPCEHCISLRYLYEDHEKLYIITDLCLGENMNVYYKKHLEEFSEMNCLRVLNSILKGLAHLDSLGIVHRDIKPSNWMIKDPRNPYHCVIVDFGFSYQFTEEERNIGFCVT